jgi:hypothetical protein
LRKTNDDDDDFNVAGLEERFTKKVQKVSDPRNFGEVAQFVSKVVLPPIRVDPRSIGGTTFEEYPENMNVETLLTFKCRSFELTGDTHISVSCLQNPTGYAKHKRSLGMMGKSSKGRNKVHYVIFARSTNRPLMNTDSTNEKTEVKTSTRESVIDSGYDKMFSPGEEDLIDEEKDDLSAQGDDDASGDNGMRDLDGNRQGDSEYVEVSSFPVLLCMTLNTDGTSPDIRKLINCQLCRMLLPR